MTFDLRDPNVVQKIIQAADPKNFNYSEAYFLQTPSETYTITGSIRTLTILTISAHYANLYTKLFHNWTIADQSPLTFHQGNFATITLYSDWIVRARFGIKDEAVFEVSKPGAFQRLEDYLQ